MTATSRRVRRSGARSGFGAGAGSGSATIAGLVGLALALGGCGTAAVEHSPAPVALKQSGTGAFAWLRMARPAMGWHVARIASGATLAYPPDWRAIAGDAGTASAALLDGHGRYLGYLNITPREGAERLSGWASFRARHNRAEGDREVSVSAAASGLRFAAGEASCVRDTYTTATRARFVELACLVRGEHTSTVVVGAAPPQEWAREAPTIEQALSTLTS